MLLVYESYMLNQEFISVPPYMATAALAAVGRTSLVEGGMVARSQASHSAPHPPTPCRNISTDLYWPCAGLSQLPAVLSCLVVSGQHNLVIFSTFRDHCEQSIVAQPKLLVYFTITVSTNPPPTVSALNSKVNIHIRQGSSRSKSNKWIWTGE